MLYSIIKKLANCVITAATTLASFAKISAVAGDGSAPWNAYFNNQEGKLYQLLTDQPITSVDNHLTSIIKDNNYGITPATVFGSTSNLLKIICEYPPYTSYNASLTEKGHVFLYGASETSLNDTSIQ